jgi:hypothetical protein
MLLWPQSTWVGVVVDQQESLKPASWLGRRRRRWENPSKDRADMIEELNALMQLKEVCVCARVCGFSLFVWGGWGVTGGTGTHVLPGC